MRGLLKALAISIAAFPGLLIGQTVRVPPINLSGAVGCIGFPCVNTGTVQLPSDADYTMPSTLSQPFTSASSVKFTSAVSLTATRSIIYPAGRFPIDVENATSGGQVINICGPSGSCAQIPNDSAHFTRVWNDGTNFISGQPSIGGVSQIVAGSNISISGGTGAVTISATGAASPGPHITTTTSTSTTIILSTSPGYTVYTGTLITSGSISFTLPSVTAGQEQCVATVLGGAAGTTNLHVSVFGSQVIQYASQSSTPGGYALSASNSSACFIGIDSTQWLLVTNDQIAWTLH